MSKDKNQENGRTVGFSVGRTNEMPHGETGCKNSDENALFCKCSRPVIPGNQCKGFVWLKVCEKKLGMLAVCPATTATNPSMIRGRANPNVSDEQLAETRDQLGIKMFECPYNLDGNCKKR